MSITVYTYNDKVLKNVATDKWLKKYVDPYNPLNLPPNTVRVRTNNGNAPYKGRNTSYETATLVTGTTDIYDVYKSGTDFEDFLRSSSNVVEVLGANTTGITNMYSMFMECTSLTTVPLFDTSSCILMGYTFSTCRALTSVPLYDTSNATTLSGLLSCCSSLTTIPLFNTSKATNVSDMVSYCNNVESGALALYQQVSTQTNPPSNHANCFSYCGSNTVTGAAELAQIPTSWGGTAS